MLPEANVEFERNNCVKAERSGNNAIDNSRLQYRLNTGTHFHFILFRKNHSKESNYEKTSLLISRTVTNGLAGGSIDLHNGSSYTLTPGVVDRPYSIAVTHG
jgi:hypothetical protein